MARAKAAGKSPERRTEIIAALERCILKQGYLNTSVRDIAKEAGIHSGAIHYYFESKEQILERLMEAIIEKYSEDAFLALSKEREGRSPRQMLSVLAEFLFLKFPREKQTNRMFLELWYLSRHDETLGRMLKELYRTYRAEIAKHLSECLHEMGLGYESIEPLAALLVSASEGLCQQVLIDPKGTSITKVSEVAEQLIKALVDADDPGEQRGKRHPA